MLLACIVSKTAFIYLNHLIKSLWVKVRHFFFKKVILNADNTSNQTADLVASGKITVLTHWLSNH